MRILDQNAIEFSLEKLRNCSLLDAYRVLFCKRKALSDQEKAFLIPKDKIILFGKSDFYIQKVSLPKNLEKAEDKIYLIENVVMEFCSTYSKIFEHDWWLAANCGAQNFRIIAGIGKGIILSRFLPLYVDISEEISKTIMYLQRFGLKEEIKVFSSMEEIKIHLKISSEINCQKIFIPECNETETARLLGRIKPVMTDGIHIKLLNDKALYIALLAIIFILCKVEQSIRHTEKVISSLRKNTRIITKYIELEINNENFSAIKQFVSSLKKSHHPLELFEKASDICRKYDLSIEHLSFENETIKIKTSVHKSVFDELKTIDGTEVVKNNHEEYEELRSNKKYGAIVCIK
ncbi:MAG: hypothetical protein LBC04_03950 [Holosporaceae bacterium]|jgi:hypothetical protein|nr:hypothetical protein [Holosporaceae bacterium]